MKHMLRLRKYHCFLGINIPFLYNDGLRAALAQSLTCSWKQHRSVWRAWGDRRACAPHVRNEQPQRKAGPSLDISTVTTSHSSRARTLEGGPALYEPGRLATLPADSRLRRRSHSLLRSSPQNRRQKSSLYKAINGLSVSSLSLRPPCSWRRWRPLRRRCPQLPPASASSSPRAPWAPATDRKHGADRESLRGTRPGLRSITSNTTSLAAQWLRLPASHAGGSAGSLVRELSTDPTSCNQETWCSWQAR